ncbi:MAG: glycosyltransferase [Vicinamibacterales bacterium]
MLITCTIVARNYLPHARVLTTSFLRHHPGGTVYVLLIDDEDAALDASGEPFRVLRLQEIGLDRDEVRRLAAIYDVVELATSVKPPLLRWLLDRHGTHAIYLDPDIEIFAPLTDIAALAEARGVVLTPHTSVPVPRDGRRISTEEILSAGVFNLGFVAVGPAAGPLLAWWWGQTRRHALADPGRMLFTDQRWMDLAPAYFDPCVVKDPGLNVAYWNLHGRALTWTGTGYEVDGQPLRFFHFSGFDHRRPHLLSKHQADRPRILLSERPALKRLCDEYLDDLRHAGIDEPATLGYGWDALPSGLRLDRRIRRLYWAALVDFEEGRGPEPPSPFCPDTPDRFAAWLSQPGPDGPATLSRYELAIYRSRLDLHPAFPRLDDPDEVGRLRHWLATDGVSQEGLSVELLQASARATAPPLFAPPADLTPGVNVAGYLQAELGIGEAGRALVGALAEAGIDHATIDYDRTLSRRQHAFAPRGDGRAPFDVNVVCVNADATPGFARDVGPTFFDGRHTAGYWFWELERFPPSLYGAFDHVDEVWTATRFVERAVAAAGARPVHRVPLPVEAGPIDPRFDRRHFGLPDTFVFLFAFDFLSVVERKNPLGLIEAFTRAFRPGDGPTLFIKTINGHLRLTDLEHVRAAIGGRADIRLVDAYYSRAEQHALTSVADCYVSLHRSEGLGLTMAEAMSLGVPVIATAYSGNLDFMTPSNSFLVDHGTGHVPAGVAAYAAGTPWAEPDLDMAAAWMRRVVEDPAEAAARAARGRQDVATTLSLAASAAAVAARLDAIRAARRARIFTPAPPPDAGPAGTAPVRPAFEQATALLTPATGVAPTARWRQLRLGLQRLLLRMLRPYWFQQRELARLTLDAVRAVDVARAADARRHDAASRDLDAVRAELAELSGRVGRLEAAPPAGRPRASAWPRQEAVRRPPTAS